MKALVLALVLCSAHALVAQEQEGKLMNRLLRPNTAQGNPSQNKKFGSDKTPTTKHAPVSTFYLQKSPDTREYSNTREFSTRDFGPRTYEVKPNASLLAARSTADLRSYDAPRARVSAELRDGHKSASTTHFAGNRPFLAQGKSQKSLDRKNKPMSIDDIRELLNKSK